MRNYDIEYVHQWVLEKMEENPEEVCEYLLKLWTEGNQLRRQLKHALARAEGSEHDQLLESMAYWVDLALQRHELRKQETSRADQAEAERDRLKAQLSVLTGEACMDEQEAGNGSCGSCVPCLRQELDRYSRALIYYANHKENTNDECLYGYPNGLDPQEWIHDWGEVAQRALRWIKE